MPKSWKIINKLDSKNSCSFCKRRTVDEFKYGEIYQYADIKVHYFCLLFASYLLQHGRDDQGLLGFLLPDIRRELKRNGKVICYYCKKPGASCSCGSKKCDRNFHFPCGLENNTFHTFRGTFRSFCADHSIKPAIPSHFFNQLDLICVICQERISNLTHSDIVHASCCNNLCFHKPCIQKMALSAGYFFKCPNCNDKKKFRNCMLSNGIYIPNMDAAWELAPNSYRELYEQYNSCDARNCLCPFGQSYSDSAGSWAIIRCNMCGSQGIHRKCGKNVIYREEWTCYTCSEVGTSATVDDCVLNTSRRRSAGSSRRTSVYGIKNRKYHSRRITELEKITLDLGQDGTIPKRERRILCTVGGVRVSILPSCKSQLKRLKIVL